jgi:zinc protease
VQDYLFQFKAGIEKVTTQDVLEAARRHLHPDQQVVVIAANAEALRPQLEAQGRRVVPLVLDD